MRTTIMVYSQNAYKEYQLPVDDNIEYTVVLRKELFSLVDSLKLKLENLKGKWYFRENDAEIKNKGVSCINCDKIASAYKIDHNHLFYPAAGGDAVCGRIRICLGRKLHTHHLLSWE